MPRRERITAATPRRALESVRRVCYAGLDAVALRREVLRRVAPAVGADAYMIAATDPDTGLVAHVVGEHVPAAMAREYFAVLYPGGEAERMLALARDGRGVAAIESPAHPAGEFHARAFPDFVRAHGFAREVRTVLTAEGRLWGTWCTLRDGTASPFGERERRFLRAVAPHVARGLRAAALLDASGHAPAAGAAAAPAAPPPR